MKKTVVKKNTGHCYLAKDIKKIDNQGKPSPLSKSNATTVGRYCYLFLHPP